MNFPPITSSDNCDRYWEDADWLPPWYILNRWCQQDAPCRQAKQQALLSACERGEVHYQRQDGKTFDDPIHELMARGILLIERASFDAWATQLDGKSPLQTISQPVKLPPPPVWANESWTAPTQPAHTAIPEFAADESMATNKTAPTGKTSDIVPNKLATDVPSVTSNAIIEAFRIKENETENTEWWDERLRDAKRYGLLDARTSKGRLRIPSYWRPDLIAAWLIDRKHLSAKTVIHIVLHQFPDWSDSIEYLDD